MCKKYSTLRKSCKVSLYGIRYFVSSTYLTRGNKEDQKKLSSVYLWNAFSLRKLFLSRYFYHFLLKQRNLRLIYVLSFDTVQSLLISCFTKFSTYLKVLCCKIETYIFFPTQEESKVSYRAQKLFPSSVS